MDSKLYEFRSHGNMLKITDHICCILKGWTEYQVYRGHSLFMIIAKISETLSPTPESTQGTFISGPLDGLK